MINEHSSHLYPTCSCQHCDGYWSYYSGKECLRIITIYSNNDYVIGFVSFFRPSKFRSSPIDLGSTPTVDISYINLSNVFLRSKNTPKKCSLSSTIFVCSLPNWVMWCDDGHCIDLPPLLYLWCNLAVFNRLGSTISNFLPKLRPYILDLAAHLLQHFDVVHFHNNLGSLKSFRVGA